VGGNVNGTEGLEEGEAGLEREAEGRITDPGRDLQLRLALGVLT